MAFAVLPAAILAVAGLAAADRILPFIASGGAWSRVAETGGRALSAARALMEYEADAEKLGRKAMEIAADICVYTNTNFTIESIETTA